MEITILARYHLAPGFTTVDGLNPFQEHVLATSAIYPVDKQQIIQIHEITGQTT